MTSTQRREEGEGEEEEDEFVSEDEDIILGMSSSSSSRGEHKGRSTGEDDHPVPCAGPAAATEHDDDGGGEQQQKQQQHSLQASLGEEEDACSSSRHQPPCITSHFDSVLECLDFMSMVENDDGMEKRDVIEAIRGRLHGMLSKILLNNSITSMSMMGWRLQQ